MNKNECKKYLKRAYKRLRVQGNNITPENIEVEMSKVINKEAEKYIYFAKRAVDTLNNSATEINEKELDAEIDVIVKIYE